MIVKTNSVPERDLKSVTVYLWNARSIVNKLNNFSSFVYTSKYKVYGITETWLSDHIYNNEILPIDYVIYRKDHSSRGGGIMLTCNNCISSRCLPTPQNIEVLVVELLTKQPIKIFLIYNLPIAPQSTIRICYLFFLILCKLKVIK